MSPVTPVSPASQSSGQPALRKVASVFLAGVASVLPVVGTAWLLVMIYRVLRGVGDAIINGVMNVINYLRGAEEWSVENLLIPIQNRPPQPWDFEFPGSTLLQALLPVLILFGIGFAVTHAPGHRALQWIEARIERVPMLGFIYSAIKQFVDAVRELGADRKFKGVAYVEYPSPGCRLLGFITGGFHDQQTGRDVTSVFLPTAPNPLTGFVLVVDNDKVTKCDMSMEEASKLIVSAGLVAPLPPGQIPATNPPQ
ncbi:MAG: DUF502 domain-containing protein [Verrucomicrobiales bacterium]|nr:DUF502 domain-containing protein [Verrucomicrobiota bacterium JB025]